MNVNFATLAPARATVPASVRFSSLTIHSALAMAKKTRRTARKKSGRTGASLRNDSIPRSLLARELQKRITQLGLSRNDAAIAVGDAASQMSRLMTGHITDFSADRLVKMLLRLGSDVTITVRHGSNAKKRGKVRVKTA